MVLALITQLPGTSIASDAKWPSGLARSFRTMAGVNLTNKNIEAYFAPWVASSGSNCKSGRVSPPVSSRPVSSSLIVFADNGACNTPTPVVLLQLYLEADPAEIRRFHASLISEMPSSCFAGILPPADPRRHAPTRRAMMWRLGSHTIVSIDEDGIPDGETVSLIPAQQHPKMSEQSRMLLDRVTSDIPASCR